MRKEHEIFIEILSKISKLKSSSELDLKEIESNFLKFYSLWDVHEKKEEENFSRVKVIDIKRYFNKVLEDHKELRPYKEKIYSSVKNHDEKLIKDTLNKNFDWLRDKLVEHFNYGEEYLFVRLSKYSDSELGFS